MDGAEARRGRDREYAVTTESVPRARRDPRTVPAPPPGPVPQSTRSSTSSSASVTAPTARSSTSGDMPYKVPTWRWPPERPIAWSLPRCSTTSGTSCPGPTSPASTAPPTTTATSPSARGSSPPGSDRRLPRAVALHVVAKRYRCTVDPAYLRRSLPDVTGDADGPGRPARQPRGSVPVRTPSGRNDALALRDWDEQAKDPTRDVAGIYTYVPVLERLARSSGPYPAAPGPRRVAGTSHPAQRDSQASGSAVRATTAGGSSPETMPAMVTSSRTERRLARTATHTAWRCSAAPS